MKIRTFILLFATVWLVGCPYYNTFYNAKKAFSEAERIRKEMRIQQGERIPEQAVQLYERAIENSALILRDHPHSDLVDDALVLIGDAFLAQGQFPQAARKYDEVLKNYPESDLAPYCMFSLGKASLSAGDTVRADLALQDFLKAHPRSEWSPEAYMLLGSLSFTQRNYEQAIVRYTDFLTSYPKHKKRGEAQYYIAQAHLESNRHTEALNLFERVSKIADTRDLEFQANYMIGECLRRDRKYESALRIFDDLLGKGAYLVYRPKILLALAACQDALNQYEDSITRYEDIIDRYDRESDYREEVSQAMYELGTVYERQGDLPLAEELYLEARQRSPNNFWVRDEADRKSQDIKELQTLKEELAVAVAALIPPDSLQQSERPDSLQSSNALDTPDSLKVADNDGPDLIAGVIEARFRLAEHYLFRFNLADSALVHYRKIEEETPDIQTAAKAAFARAWIIDHVVQDSAASAAGYQTVLAEYAGTPYASEAARALALPDPNGPSVDDIFQQAETLMLETEQPDSALHLYSMVFERYPESRYAPQALLAMGWITETHHSDPDSALRIYRRLDALYPRSEQAAAVSEKVRFIEDLMAESGVGEDAGTDAPDEVRAAIPTAGSIAFAERDGDVVAIRQDSVLIRLRHPVELEVGSIGFLVSVSDSADHVRQLARMEILSLPRTSIEEKPVVSDRNVPPVSKQSKQARIRTQGGALKLKDAPGGETIGGLKNETPVEILSESGGWLQVRTKAGETGYVSGSFVERMAPSTPAATVAVTSTQARIRTQGGALKLKDAPGGETIGGLKNETPVEILSESGGWLQVRTKAGETGYVSGRFVERIPTEAPEPTVATSVVKDQPLIVALLTEQPDRTFSDLARMGVLFDTSRLEIDAGTAEPVPEEVVLPFIEVTDRNTLILDDMTRNKSQGLVVSIDGVRLDIKMLLQKHIDVGDTGYAYIMESVNGIESALRAAEIVVDEIDRITVIKGIPAAGNVEFRDSPGGRIVSMIPPSSSLDIITDEGEWQKGLYQGQEGYVLSENLSLQTVQEEIAICVITGVYGPIDTDGWIGIRFEK